MKPTCSPTEASNALLKTLEEPPDKVVFVMATTQPEDLAETIRSRSQHFHFRALSFAEIAEALEAIANKEKLDVEPGALAVMARAADGSLRDALSLLEQARAYCGAKISEAQVRELLGVASGKCSTNWSPRSRTVPPSARSAWCTACSPKGKICSSFAARPSAISATCWWRGFAARIPIWLPRRPRSARLARAAAAFSEEDLTRFFQILLQTDDDLRRKPDPRLHLEMGLLRLVNAARLAPLEEVLAELSGNAPVRSSVPRPLRNAAAAVRSIPAKPATTPPSAAAAAPPAANASSNNPKTLASASASVRTTPVTSVDATAGGGCRGSGASSRCEPGFAAVHRRSRRLRNSMPSNRRSSPRQNSRPNWSKTPAAGNSRAAKFVCISPPSSRALADLLQARDHVEKLRTIASRVLGQPLRVCVKLEASSVPSGSATKFAPARVVRELRARFEQDPIVRAMLERFGGRISEVKRRDEG